MADTQLRKTLEDWSPGSKAEFRTDLENVNKIPPESLDRVVQEVARTYPACNIREVIAREAERSRGADPQELFDVMSGLTFLWANSGHETPQTIAQDLVSLGMASDATAKIVEELLTSTLPLREGAQALSAYLRVGAPLFVSIRGVVDIRCRFHEREQGLNSGAVPTKLIDTHTVVMASLLLNDEDDEEKTVSFLMDENDLGYLKRFVRNMEKELELSKRFSDARSTKTNG